MSRNSVLRRWPLVGREPQLKDFDDVLHDPRSSGFLIFGPAGVGKSRLAEECLNRAIGAGHRPGRAVATAAAASVPLGALAHLLPDGVDLSDPVSGFATVARLLSHPGSRSRMVFLVDDIHLLDATSAMLLRQLMDAGVVFLLGTVRSGDGEGAVAVDALGHGDAVHQVDLAAFGRRQVETLLEQVLEGPVGRSAVSQLLTTSGGNPLYLRELVAGAVAAGTLTSDGEIWEMTADRLEGTRRLSDLIRSRLSVAPSAGRQVLDVLSLCEPLSLGHLESDAAEPWMIDQLEQAGLIVVTQEERRTAVRLAHPLYGEVLRADMTAQRRRDTLLRQVRLLEKSGARRREDAIHLATYNLAATGTADPALLVRAAGLAGHAREYPRALGLLRAIPQEHRSFQIRLLLGKTLHDAGDFQAAEDVLAEADAMAVGDQEVLSAVLVRSQNLMWGIGATYERILDVIEAARCRVTDPFGLRALLAANAFTVGEVKHSLALYADLTADAGQSPDASTWLWAAMGKSMALSLTGHGEEAEDWVRRAIAFSAADTDRDEHTPAAHEAGQPAVLALALAESGRLAEAQAVGEQAFAGLSNRSVTTDRRMLAFNLARGAWLAGHPAQARRWCAEVARASRPHVAIILSMALAGLTAAAAVQGDLEAAEAARAERALLPTSGHFPEEDLGEAWLHVARGELTRARTVLAEAAQAAFDRGHTASEAILLTDLVRLGGAREAAARLAEIASECTGRFHRARADLAAAWATNDPEGLLSVADALETIGADLLAAEAASTAAALLKEAGQTRRASAAAVRAEALEARCEGARTPALMARQDVVRLTGREHEIALLAARGMFSKDIATELTLSVRTVDNHLQRVYAKLGLTTRRELADRLLP
ncbi:AAA family ATPase [Streptomyces sp. NPDC059828]|uniref:AAA family ATPase n=1 Tax=Streptomyces sp. NPDC059828 TaxID=3346965 RepID=UPI0036610565